jgi:DMSO/TMAO reductase YedYZ molybdopterin-dependent catalytic subunit
MVTRRELLLGTAGGWLVEQVWAGEAAGTAPDTLTALTGKKPLIRRSFRPPNFETPLAELAAPFTRNDAFFVRYHLAVIPQVDPAAWRLQIAGASAQHPLTLSLKELRSGFGHVSVAAVNQCAGNRRGLFTPRVPGVQWGNGAMGNALWRGVRLRDVLQRAGVAPGALEVVFDGADTPVLPATPDFLKSLPIERALDENTLIALEMNGQPLPHWNGAPARLIVPGWVATYWVKHLTSIRIEPQAFDGFWMKTAYRVPTGAFPGSRFTSQENAESTPVTELMVNSLITSHVSGARLPRGEPVELAGKAWDSGAGIEGVEVSADHGQSWREATLQRDLGRFAWREFRFPLDTSKAGPLEMSVRARSRGGAKQPDKLTPNPSGYHDNIVQTVSLEVV